LADQLHLSRHATRQRDGLVVCCPAHKDTTPSCSIRVCPDGSVRAHCFGCGFSADAIGLIAQVLGLPTSGSGFVTETLAVATELAGFGAAHPVSAAPALSPRASAPRREHTYPPEGEVATLWSAAVPLRDDARACAWCDQRGLDVDAIELMNLARAMPANALLPRWARFRGESWTITGHRIIMPVADAHGAMRSVRAIRVMDCDLPKRLPPAGHRASGLVLADAGARLVLARRLADLPSPVRIVVVEGEPDYLTWATRFSDADEDAPVVIGVVSGAWTPEIAARIPDDSRVAVWTHHDPAGDRYAADIAGTLGMRVQLWRAG